jgi:hypothetical protein
MRLDFTEPQHAMLITIEDFRRRVASDGAGLVSRLQEETGRYGSEEAQAWENSLSKLSRAFEARGAPGRTAPRAAGEGRAQASWITSDTR